MKQLQTHLLSEDREKLDVSQEFKSIASFYLDKDANFLYAETLEKGHHYIKNCIDLFIDDEIDKNKKAANEIETQDVEIEIKKLLKEKLADIYGYSQEITLKDLKDYNFNIIEERYANIKGFESFYAESILGAVCHVIYVNDIQPNNLKADEIERVVTSTREYTNVLAINNSKYLLENIKNNEIKKVITQKIDNIEGYFNKKTLFKTPTIIFNDDFKFNCDVDVVIKELSPDQINLKINEHLRKDGQYEFNGKFYSREELYETIKELMRCICVSFKYRTVFKKDNVLTFNY